MNRIRLKSLTDDETNVSTLELLSNKIKILISEFYLNKSRDIFKLLDQITDLFKIYLTDDSIELLKYSIHESGYVKDRVVFTAYNDQTKTLLKLLKLI